MPSLLGSKPNQVSTNGDLGTLAFQDANAVNITGGVIDVNAGSATVASVGAAGDENTGLFFPAADTVAVTTGGTERVRVNSSGNMSINTTASRTRLLVASSNESDTVTLGLVSGGFAVSNSNPSYGTQIGVLNSGNGWIQSMRMDGTATSYNLLLQPVGGNVGIGTTSPEQKLDVYGASGTIRSTVRSGSSFSTVFTSSTLSEGSGIVATSGSPLSFAHATNSSGSGFTERMRIDASGNVGVGTSSPNSRVTIQGTTNTRLVQLYTNGNNADYSAIGNQYSSASAFCASEIRFGNENTSSGTGFLSFATGTNTVTERARIDSSGNLGINTTAPTAMLDVNSNTVRVRTARTPASATAAGNAGDICWDANYVYVCVATNTWKRSALSTW